MIETLASVGIDCLVVFGGAFVVYWLVRSAGVLLSAIPLPRTAVARIVRWRAAIVSVAIAIYAVIAIRHVLDSGDHRGWFAFAIVTGVAIAASWSMLRNAVEGVYLRAARTFEVGDRVDVGGVKGRVHRLGIRAIVIETLDGELAIVPYRTVSSTTIRRDPFDQQSGFQVFRAPIPDGRSIVELERALREAALLCHWSSTRRLPQVAVADDGLLEITVFPIDAKHATEIERAVRRALGDAGGQAHLPMPSSRSSAVD